MYTMWPGCYSLKDEFKLFVIWFKDQADAVLFKLYEFERMLKS